MSNGPEKEILAEGKFIRLVRRGRWEWAQRTNTSGAVVIAAVTEDRELVLVDQYRTPLDARVIELPAGLSGDEPGAYGEALIEAARRELLEETGYEADDWREAAAGPSSPGLTDESYALFVARGARKVGPGGGDEAEDIEVEAVPLAEIEAWLAAKRRSGALVDPKIYAGLHFAGRA